METLRIFEPDCECSADYLTDKLGLVVIQNWPKLKAVKYYPCKLHPTYGQEEHRNFSKSPADTLKD